MNHFEDGLFISCPDYNQACNNGGILKRQMEEKRDVIVKNLSCPCGSLTPTRTKLKISEKPKGSQIFYENLLPVF